VYSETLDVPTYEYDGEIIKHVILQDKLGVVLLTKKRTLNNNIFLVSVYHNGIRRFGIRYEKTKLHGFSINALLTRFYMDEKLKNETY